MSVTNVKKTPISPNSLGFYLSRASIVFRELLKQSLAESSLKDYIKPGMVNLMFSLYEQDGVTKTELARTLSLSKMTITRLVRDIEKHGLAVSKADENDGRASRVHLTPLARKLEPEYAQLARSLEERISENFTPADLTQFRHHLKTLLESLVEKTS